MCWISCNVTPTPRGCGDWRPRSNSSTRARNRPGRESYLRLLLIEAGFPRPQTQIPVLGVDGIPVAFIDVGWSEYKVGVENEGQHHQTDRGRYVDDILRLEMLEQMGWLIVRIVAEARRADIVRRVGVAMMERGWTAQ
jgi:hypothetical protein